ncbi:hypothetical protein GCM10009865_49460 [Aeromicrobium ponti]
MIAGGNFMSVAFLINMKLTLKVSKAPTIYKSPMLKDKLIKFVIAPSNTTSETPKKPRLIPSICFQCKGTLKTKYEIKAVAKGVNPIMSEALVANVYFSPN